MTLHAQLKQARANFAQQEILVSHTVGKVYVKPSMSVGLTTIHAHESADVDWSGDYRIALGRLVLVAIHTGETPPAEIAFDFSDRGIIRKYLTGLEIVTAK